MEARCRQAPKPPRSRPGRARCTTLSPLSPCCEHRDGAVDRTLPPARVLRLTNPALPQLCALHFDCTTRHTPSHARAGLGTSACATLSEQRPCPTAPSRSKGRWQVRKSACHVAPPHSAQSAAACRNLAPVGRAQCVRVVRCRAERRSIGRGAAAAADAPAPLPPHRRRSACVDRPRGRKSRECLRMSKASATATRCGHAPS